ncbi:SubName: Full=Uncharacterized protein {ECO:0000313/EMBL:CCA77956.1} [Serendipita indica DSM 11827]|nr:SubName: Full=Uncharacterized protein {ECO:0000313/EMBL:CCA77956.1} [Serendipita indica DSM 11827]
MAVVDIKLPPVPGELKTISVWISRAQELKGKEPVIAYYCLYHATQTGIGAKTKEKEAKNFLMDLMTTLETMKEQLKDHNEINSDEAAAKYIQAFALKVFANADNEDRKGGSTRSTAKKFLAASNFFELLTIFDAKYLNPDLNVSEKIKYSKWKASDIAKAYREGRVPQAGPPALYDASEDELGEKVTASHSEPDEFSAISSYNAAVKSITVSSSTPPIEANEKAADVPSLSKPALQSSSSSNTIDTVTPARTPIVSPTPKYINTSPATSPYVIDVSSPTSTAGSKTPLKTPGLSDGLWSTAATPGIESPNMFSPFPGGSFGKAAASLMNPATLAKFNALKKAEASPISPKSKSGLSAMFVPPEVEDAGEEAKANSGNDTDEDDGQWSTGGNDPMSRQPTMMPPGTGLNNAPGLVVTPSLGAVQEEGIVLAVPLPPSANNTAPSSPDNRPNSLLYAASQPLPPILPPSVQTPSSIKSETHALPGVDNKSYKYTSHVVGDSTSDGEASYNAPRRTNATQKGTNLAPDASHSTHGRSSSINEPPLSAPPTTAKPSGSAPDDDWERTSLSRLARLPHGNSEMDSLSERLRDLGDLNTSTPSLHSTSPGPSDSNDPEHKTRRNTIRASAPSRPVSTDFGLSLPGVPSAPPVGEWKGKGNDDGSDSGGGGDMMARLPSAPAVPPIVQDQLPHVTVLPKPSTPREEIHVNPYFPAQGTPSAPSSRFTPYSEHPAINGYNTTSPPSVPPSATSSTFIHRGYTPPNSVTSPQASSVNGILPPTQYGAPMMHPAGQYAPSVPIGYHNGMMNGTGPARDEFGIELPNRPPPTELDPETIGKAQKHTKFALSALNFEDLETAREELKKALRLLS